MLNPKHLRRLVVRPTLQALAMHSPAAEQLMMVTAVQESRLEALSQYGNGPACGLWQVEPATAADIAHRYLESRDETERRFERAVDLFDQCDIDFTRVGLAVLRDKLRADLRFCCAIARIRYWMDPEALPGVTDAAGMAAYWKRVFNSELGAGTEAQFLEAWSDLAVAETRALD